MAELRAKGDEEAIREAFARGDMRAATTATLRRYGGEVLGFLIGLHKNQTDADEAFSIFAERLWKTLPAFEWKCSMRTWVYLLARRASIDLRRGAERGHAAPLSAVGEVSALIQRVRTETLSLLRTDKRDAFQRLRDELTEEDRALLILRVDRELSYRDIARVLNDNGEEEQALELETVRLRKRFQMVKKRLRELGRERGLL